MVVRFATAIFGGTLTGGASPYLYTCLNAAAFYMIMVESKCIWLQRSSVGSFGKVRLGGFIGVMRGRKVWHWGTRGFYHDTQQGRMLSLQH